MKEEVEVYTYSIRLHASFKLVIQGGLGVGTRRGAAERAVRTEGRSDGMEFLGRLVISGRIISRFFCEGKTLDHMMC